MADVSMRKRYERYKEFEKIVDEFKNDLDCVKISRELIYLREQVEKLKDEITSHQESNQSENEESK
jgi:cobalamin biosynthesis Co2+ chelatase CbiK